MICAYPECDGFSADKLLCIDHWMGLPLFLRMAWLTACAEQDKPARAAAATAILDHLDEAKLLKELGF